MRALATLCATLAALAYTSRAPVPFEVPADGPPNQLVWCQGHGDMPAVERAMNAAPQGAIVYFGPQVCDLSWPHPVWVRKAAVLVGLWVGGTVELRQ